MGLNGTSVTITDGGATVKSFHNEPYCYTPSMDQEPRTDPIDAVAALAEPTRRSLYELVAASDQPVGRDDAVSALGISRELAAFHLDRLVAAGLLTPEYRRRSGRTGPGAGRPAKLYRRTRGLNVELSLPARRYRMAAEIFAEGLDRRPDDPARDD